MLKSSKKTAGKKNSKKKVVLSVCLAAALLITGAVAFMTATDSADNVFTVGNVKIDLTEPNWDETKAEDIISGQVIAKDPTVTNTGANNAYVYVMVEVPKVYKTDIVSQNAEGKWVTEEKSQYQLFDYAVNDGWTLIDSKVTTKADSDEAYNYYLYAYDTSVAPAGSVTLFDEVKFANVTSNFINTVTGEEIVDLNINVTSYAIQSDFYGNEATDAESAWSLFANQNEWQWPSNAYEGITTLNFVSEDEVVHSETDYAGAPVTMFFTSSLARTGYSFDWVDETTGKTGYTGMPMPEEDTNMIAVYSEETSEGVEVSKYGYYAVKQAEDGHLYAVLEGFHSDIASYPTEAATAIIPATITVVKDEDGRHISSDGTVAELYGEFLSVNKTYNLPVESVESLSTKSFEGKDVKNIETIILPDSVNYIGNPKENGNSGVVGGLSGDFDTIKAITLPYGITVIDDSAFNGFVALEAINLPNSLTKIGKSAFTNTNLKTLEIPDSVTSIGRFSGDPNASPPIETIKFGNGANLPDHICSYLQSLKTVTIPDGVTEIGEYAFVNCTNLQSVTIGTGVTTIKKSTFSGCSNLNTITLNGNVTNIEENAFINCTALTDVYLGTTDIGNINVEPSGNDILLSGTINLHFPNAE